MATTQRIRIALAFLGIVAFGWVPDWNFAFAQTGYVWCKVIHSPGWNESGNDVECDSAGNVLICGDYDNNAVFGGSTVPSVGGSDSYVARLDGDGAYEWVHPEGSLNTDRTFGVRAGSDGHVYAAGYGRVIFPTHRSVLHAWDALTWRIRPDGSLHWGWAMNGDVYSESRDIAPDAAGNSYTVGLLRTQGWYGTDTLNGHGLEDAFVVKFDSVGDYVWGRAMGGTLDDAAYGVDVDANGQVWVGGSFQGIADFGGVNLTSAGGTDAFLIKLDSAGNILTRRHFDGPGSAEILRVKVSLDGDCYFVGNFSRTLNVGGQTLTATDTLDVFYGKADVAGNVLWAKQAGGLDMDFAQDLAVDDEENLYIDGFFFGGFRWQADTVTSAGYDDFFFAKTDSNGILTLFQPGMDPNSRDLFGIAVDPAQNVLVTGVFSDTLTLGPVTYNSTNGTTDAFVAKYATRNPQIAIRQLIGSPYCSSDQFDVRFQVWGYFDSTNVFFLELSDATGSFAVPTVIGSRAGSFGGTITGTIPLGISQGTQYRVRIRSTSPTVLSPDNGQDLTLDPTTAVPVTIFGDTVLCAGNPVILSVDSSLAHQQWSTGDTTALITVWTPGLIWVEATDSNGCSNRDEVLVTLCVANSDPLPHPLLRLYPNPNSGVFRISATGLPPGAYRLTVFDVLAREVASQEVRIGTDKLDIPVVMPEGAAGMHTVLLNGMDTEARLRFTRQ